MEIQIKAGRLQMGAEALEEISRALKRESEEILSARRTLEFSLPLDTSDSEVYNTSESEVLLCAWIRSCPRGAMSSSF